MGMFDSYLNRGATERQNEEQRRLNLGQMNEGQRLGYYAVSGGADAGQGLSRAIGSAVGADMRSQGERDQDSVRAVQDEMKTLDTSAPDYLLKLAQLFQKHGFVQEAQNAMVAHENQKVNTERQSIARGESERKAAADKRLAANRETQTAINAQKLDRMGPAVVQLGNALDDVQEQMQTLDPADPRYRALSIKGDAIVQAMANASRGTLKYVNAGDRVYVQDAAGNTIKELVVGAKPGSTLASDKEATKQKNALTEAGAAYASAKNKLQDDYNSVVQLYNHPGLEKFVGPVIGAAAQQSPEKSGFMGNIAAATARGKDGEAAYALFQKVQGGTFINALADLKAASKTGATGLGAVSEVEGSKVQSAKASLNPQQDPAAFRAALKSYANVLANSGLVLDQKAQGYEITPVPLQPGQFTGPRRAAALARPQPAASGAQEWVRGPDGRLQPKGK